MNFVSGIPVLFGFVMYTGGPTAAFSNWTMVGGLSFVVSLSMAEIAAALPTAGGIYYCKRPIPVSCALNSLLSIEFQLPARSRLAPGSLLLKGSSC